MLTIKEPLKLKSLTKITLTDESFSRKLMADYTVINGEMAQSDLLYLAVTPMGLSIQEGSMTSLVTDNSLTTNQETKIYMANHIINRILCNINSGYTYRDCVTISILLGKLGIRDTSGFIRQIKRMTGMESRIKEQIGMYLKYKENFQRPQEEETTNRLTGRQTIQNTENSIGKDRLYLHQSILKRLNTREIYQEVSRFARQERVNTEREALLVSQQSRFADWIWLAKLKQETQKGNSANIFHFHNVYEAIPAEQESAAKQNMISQAAASVLVHMMGLVFEQHAQSYMSHNPVWVQMDSKAFFSAGDTLKRLEQNYKDQRFDYNLEQGLQDMVTNICQEELNLWNEYIKSRNHQEWRLFYSRLSLRIGQWIQKSEPIKTSQTSQTSQNRDTNQRFETQHQKIMADIYHKELSLLEKYGMEYRNQDDKHMLPEYEKTEKPESFSGDIVFKPEPRYQYYEDSLEYQELLNRIAKEELELVLKFPPAEGGIRQEKETDIRKYLQWLHKEYIKPEAEPAVEPGLEPNETEYQILQQIQELSQMETRIVQLYEGQGPEYSVKSTCLNQMIPMVLEQASLYNLKAYEELSAIVNQLQIHNSLSRNAEIQERDQESFYKAVTTIYPGSSHITGGPSLNLEHPGEEVTQTETYRSVPDGFQPIFSADYSQKHITQFIRADEGKTVKNQNYHINVEQLKQSLEQMNQEHRSIQNQLKQSFTNKTEETPKVVLDITRTRQQGLLALEHPEKLLIDANTPEGGWPVTQQHSREVNLLLDQMDGPSRELYEKILNYYENPSSGAPDGYIRKGTVEQLIAGIEEGNREYLEFEHQKQEKAVAKHTQEPWGNQAITEYLEHKHEVTLEVDPGADTGPSAIPLIHKKHEPELTEEIISYLTKSQSQVKTEEISTRTAATLNHQIIEQKKEISQASGQNIKDIQDMIEQGINSRIGSISETVLGKLEKRLLSDRARRGF